MCLYFRVFGLMEIFFMYDVGFSYVKGAKSVCVFNKLQNLQPPSMMQSVTFVPV